MPIKNAVLWLGIILVAVSVQAAPKSKNLVKNGDFKKSRSRIDPWIFEKKAHGWAEVNVEKAGGIRVQTKSTSAYWYLRIQQKVDVKKGYKYKLRFEAMTSAPSKKAIGVWVRQYNREDNSDYKASLKEVGVALEENWKQFEYEFTVEEMEKEGRKWSPVELCFLLGNLDGDFFLRNVSMLKVKE